MLRELALYYPGRVLTPSLPVRNLALLFDGIAILNPPGEPELSNATPLTEELQREELLEVFPADQLYDESVVAGMASFLRAVASHETVDRLRVPDNPSQELFVETDVGRAGALGPHGASLGPVLDGLHDAGLTRPTVDPLRVVMHRDLRIAILTEAADLLARRTTKNDIRLHPVTDVAADPVTPVAGDAGAGGPLRSSPDPSKWFSTALVRAASADLTLVGIEEAQLASTPLSEIKSYREENRKAYEAYRDSLANYVWSLEAALHHPSYKTELQHKRLAELQAASEEVRAVNRERWKETITFAMSGLKLLLPPLAGLVLLGPAGAVVGGGIGAATTSIDLAKLALDASREPWAARPTAFSYLVNLPSRSA
jgi:hypothetical protein